MRKTSKSVIKVLYQMLYDTDRLLTFNDITYWLTMDSFLGAIRHGGIVPWHDCIDISIQSRQSAKLQSLKSVFSKCGYTISREFPGFHIHRKNSEYPCIRVCTMKKVKTKVVASRKTAREEFPDNVFKMQELFPLKRIAFGGFLAFVPREYKEYLKANYGRSWKSKDEDGKSIRSFQPAKPMEIKQRKCLPALRSQKRGDSKFNQYFNRVFVINLHDYRSRLKQIVKGAKRKGIEFTLFDAIDGRCKTEEECKRKRKALEKEYHIRISKDEKMPPLSLTLGTWYLLKQQVKHKWKRIAILEDDAVFVKNFNSRFAEGVKELKKVAPKWDLLYLGCTQFCGVKGLTKKRTSRTKNLTTINKFVPKANFYVQNKWDIRLPCDREECLTLSKNISIAAYPGGTFGYGISLKGAKKILKIMGGKIDDHIDGILPGGVEDGKLHAVSFDPPVIIHYGGAERGDTAIEWDWEVGL